jgi:hypothetical protein
MWEVDFSFVFVTGFGIDPSKFLWIFELTRTSCAECLQLSISLSLGNLKIIRYSLGSYLILTFLEVPARV